MGDDALTNYLARAIYSFFFEFINELVSEVLQWYKPFSPRPPAKKQMLTAVLGKPGHGKGQLPSSLSYHRAPRTGRQVTWPVRSMVASEPRRTNTR